MLSANGRLHSNLLEHCANLEVCKLFCDIHSTAIVDAVQRSAAIHCTKLHTLILYRVSPHNLDTVNAALHRFTQLRVVRVSGSIGINVPANCPNVTMDYSEQWELEEWVAKMH